MKIGIMLFIVSSMAVSILTLAQENCRVLRTTDPKTDVWITAENIKESGEYCLSHDIEAPRVYGVFGERGFPNSEMLRIEASDVVFDLHEHAMNVEAVGMVGISAGDWKKPPSQKRITIRNGIVRSRTRTAIAFNAPDGSLISDFAIHEDQAFATKKFRGILEKLPKSARDYERTNYLVERMRVQSEGINTSHICPYCKSVSMKGAANIIRNSTIEVTDGHAAIYLFGPNQLIENNIIIFKGKAAVESAAAIKLHQADGTIIRNNDIIIESTGDEAPKAAISLIDSKNVIAENNRIYGIKALAHAWDDKSSLIDRNNEFRSMLRRPWPSAEPGVRP